jgi:uncharacterized phiE125 gp8 family phage protein
MVWADADPALKLVTPPTAEPLSYEQAKAFLRLPDDTDTAYVLSLITAARSKVEQDTGLLLMTQTWDLSFDEFPSDAIRPAACPLQSVTSITTVSVAGASSVLAATNYQVDIASMPGRIVLSDSGAWPTDLRDTHAITIRLVAGYASAALVPEPLKLAMQQILSVYYQHRTGMTMVLPPRWLGYDALIAPYRLWGAV